MCKRGRRTNKGAVVVVVVRGSTELKLNWTGHSGAELSWNATDYGFHTALWKKSFFWGQSCFLSCIYQTVHLCCCCCRWCFCTWRTRNCECCCFLCKKDIEQLTSIYKRHYLLWRERRQVICHVNSNHAIIASVICGQWVFNYGDAGKHWVNPVTSRCINP